MENLFNESDFALFAKYQGKTQNEAPEGFEKLRGLYDKLGVVLEELNRIGYHTQINRNPLIQGGPSVMKYSSYHWAKIYPKDNSHYKECDGKVFVVIGTTEDGIDIHLDSNSRKGHNSDKNEITKNLKNDTWCQIEPFEAAKYTTVELAQKVNEFFQDNWVEFNQFAKEFGIQKSIEILKNMDILKITQLLTTNRNLILNGAPGTGKTYLAKQIAQQMIFGEIKEKMTDEEKKQFDIQCEFVQFHPSYDYTDFVEGLRPVKSVKNDNKNIGFERKDGVFKAFCKNALIKQTANASVTDKLNDNPTVWKVSLAKTGDNAIRKYCMDHGCIRIGWDDYGDIEDFSDYNGFTNGGKNVLNAFQNQMKQGDIIASCWSENEVDAIGVVTGDYEYNDALSDYKRVRKVDWLVKGIKEYIVAINNNKKFTLSTVYMSNITVEDALKIVTKHSTQTINNVNRHFVFIIDEINRGEISKVFGELFFSIDPGYRGKEKGKIKTQYQNLIEQGDVFYDGFYVPENVYIIGTMNDIDRSVESMDFAFRRRFAFKEITAEESKQMLDSENAWGKDENGNLRKPDQVDIDTIKSKMDAINNVIWHKEKEEEKDEDKSIEGLSSAYHIGASYFLKLVNYKNADGSYDYDQLWENHLEGLLLEYMRGMADVQKKIKKLANAYGYSKMNKYE